MQIEKKKLNTFKDSRGSLIPIEFKDLEWEPLRLFYITNVTKNCRRGEHAHFKNKQLLICIKGSIRVNLNNLAPIILNENEYLYVPNLVWDSQDFLTDDTILLVLCSMNYDITDYIFDKTLL